MIRAAAITVNASPAGVTSTSLASDIQHEHDAAQRGASDAVEHALRCGALLIKQKAALKHGEFDKWLASNVTIPRSTAKAYMQIARVPPQQISGSAGCLSIRKLLAIPREGKAKQPKQRPKQWDPAAASMRLLAAIECEFTKYHAHKSDGRAIAYLLRQHIKGLDE